jgi:hypothetical protein
MKPMSINSSVSHVIIEDQHGENAEDDQSDEISMK